MSDSAPAVKAATPEPAADTGTSYILLQQDGTTVTAPLGTTPATRTWREIGGRTARSAEAAIRAYAATAGSTTPLVLVAVPARSWAPMKTTPKTVTTLEIEEIGHSVKVPT